MTLRRPGQMRELVAACIAWPSIVLFVLSFVGLFFDPGRARWFLGISLTGIITAIGIAAAPAKRYFATAFLLWLRPWARKAQGLLQRKAES